MTSLVEQSRPSATLPISGRALRGPSGRLLVAIFVGGMVGAVARALVDRALPTARDAWPWATFTVNVAGSLLLGYFATRLQERLPPSTFRRPFLGTGRAAR
jgi:CrcB protein